MPKADPLPPYPGLSILACETVWDGRFPLQRVRFRQRRFDGRQSRERVWELWRRGRAVALLPYDPEADVVLLIEQFRLPALAAGVDPVLIEVPAGLCDPGEDQDATLARETEEELGLPLLRARPIGTYLLSPGGCDEQVTIFVGEVRAPQAGPDGLAGHGGLEAEAEDIRIRVWPAQAAIDAALAGHFNNATIAIALLWFAAKRAELQAEWKVQ